jgi:antitoxin (DNA-binding transcriptional repressor) of toxin-antitoxin stability system
MYTDVQCRMAVLTISEARAALPEVVTRAAEGEEITITRHGAPVAVMVRPDIVWARSGAGSLQGEHSADDDGDEDDAQLIAALRARARKHGLTLEEELRMILDKAESQPPQPLPPIRLKFVRTGHTEPITREDIYGDDGR